MAVERSVIDIDRSQVGNKERGRIVALGSNPADKAWEGRPTSNDS